jgi:hypothetical protein
MTCRPFILSFTCLFGILIVLISGCANPVPPNGGDKDTAGPIIVSIESEVLKTGQKRVVIAFDENISTSGAILTSPRIINPNASTLHKTEQRVKRNTLFLTLPSYTQTIYLSSTLVDLNEKNKFKQPTLLLGNDTGEIHISIDETDVKKKYNVFILKDSFIEISEKKNTTKYHFDGLKLTSHLTYVIENDNNNTIDNNERYNVFYSTPRARDTFSIGLYPSTKRYKNHYFTKDNKHVVIGSPFYEEWYNLDSLGNYNDTLHFNHYQENIFKNDLLLDTGINTNRSFTYENKYQFGILNSDTIKSTLGYYGFNSTKYSTVIHKGFQDSSKKTYLYLGKTNIQNSSDSNVMVSIQNDKMHYITTMYKQTNKDIVLPEGQYQITSWINIESNEEPYQKLNIDSYNPKTGKLFSESEVFLSLQKPLIVKKNIENTLILPKTGMYNTGVTTK